MKKSKEEGGLVDGERRDGWESCWICGFVFIY